MIFKKPVVRNNKEMKKEFLDVRGRVWKLIKQVDANMDTAATAEDLPAFNRNEKVLKKAINLMQLDDMEDDSVLRIHDLNGTTQERLEEIEQILTAAL